MRFNTYPNNPFPPSTDQMGKAGSGGSESEALEAIAPEFSVAAQYMTGDLVFYEGQLYRFEEDHDPGAWDSTEVMATTIAENLVMFPGVGLRRTIHTYDIKLQTGGGLDVDENGALYTTVVHNYSTTEQPTGQKWIDGSDIYFKVVSLAEELTLTSQTWTLSDMSGADIAVILNAFGVDANGTFFTFNATPDANNTGNVGFLQTRNASITITKFVLFYTKQNHIGGK